MPEYISREAALTVVERLRDKCGNDEMAFALNWASGLLRNVPAADVVEVVRCADCVHYNDKMEMYCDIVCTIRHYCDSSPIIVGKDDFCSSGKRKDGGMDDV